MYTFEFTDKEIKIYNHKSNDLFVFKIDNNIIIKNRVYDYLKLKKIINNILNEKYEIKGFFKPIINVLVFFNTSPTEIYIYDNLFKGISNANVRIVNSFSLIDEKILCVSGNKLYFNNKEVLNIKKLFGSYALVGHGYNSFKNKLLLNKNINIYEFINSETILYEKIK